MRKSIRVTTAVATAVALMSFAANAFATDTGVTAGSLTGPSTSSLMLGNIGTLNLSATQTATGSESIALSDNRGSGAGWKVSVAATDFQATGITDPTGPNGATLTVTLPAASVLTAAVNSLNVTAGQDAADVVRTTTATAVTNAGITLLRADAGYGMGNYSSTINYAFTLPKTVQAGNVVSTDNTTSKFKSGNTMVPGIFAGTYTTTVTYTTSNTP